MKTCYKQALFFLDFFLVLTKFQHLVELSDENKRTTATYLLRLIRVGLLFYVGRASAENFRAYQSRGSHFGINWRHEGDRCLRPRGKRIIPSR